MISHTFTSEDVKNIHNGKCDIYAAIDRLKGVVNDSLIERLERGLSLINLGMEAYYEAETKDDDKERKAFREISEKHSLKTVWSCETRSAQMNDVVAFGDVESVVYEGRSLQVKSEGLTWLDLWKAADRLILQGGETDHIFVEGFSYIPEKKALSVLTGS